MPAQGSHLADGLFVGAVSGLLVNDTAQLLLGGVESMLDSAPFPRKTGWINRSLDEIWQTRSDRFAGYPRRCGKS